MPASIPLKVWIFSAVFISLLGSLFHFTYEWSNRSNATAWFSAVDESLWEHCKLLLWPWLIVTFSFWMAYGSSTTSPLLIGLTIAWMFIPLAFAAYTLGDTQNAVLAVDISLFILSILLGLYVARVLYNKHHVSHPIGGIFIGVTLITAATLFSYEKPDGWSWLMLPGEEHEA
jgi:hypothetical protein